MIFMFAPSLKFSRAELSVSAEHYMKWRAKLCMGGIRDEDKINKNP